MDTQDTIVPFEIDLLPELATAVGMSGATVEVEVGGQVCFETGVLIVMSLA